MKARTISLLLVCLFATALAAGARARQAPAAGELAGTYVAGHYFGGRSIQLNADGTYSEDSGSCTYTTREAGKYVLAGGLLRFTILKYTGRRNGAEQEVDLFDPQAQREFFGIREGEEVGPLKTEFTLRPVHWGGRIYLIDESSLQDFSNAVNLGLEPRTSPISEPYYGSFLLRTGDEEKSVSGKPSLPERWQSFLLDEPVTARVLALEGQGETRVAVINRGSRSGLKVGMKLVGKGQSPSPWSGEGTVVSVDETTAKIEARESKVGDTLSTKYVPKDDLRNR